MAKAIATPLSPFRSPVYTGFPCLYGRIIHPKMQFVNKLIAFWRFAQWTLSRNPGFMAISTYQGQLSANACFLWRLPSKKR